MTAVLNLLIPFLAALAALAGIYFMIRAFSSRSAETRATYNVARQHAHRDKQVELIRAVFSFIVALILLGVYGFTPRPLIPAATPTPMPAPPPTAVPPTPTTAPTQPTATLSPATPQATTAPTDAPTQTATAVPPTATPADIPTTAPLTATVNSGVGVWLRAEPNTTSEQLEWLLDGTILTVLPETAAAENLAWQQVQTAEGLVGWVAVPFITYNE
ncbi:MAG: SH3 domain-containing protein [Anaerolineae bacterium]|nr:SH3 domain-containing protein [Anaerolineae bacterium]